MVGAAVCRSAYLGSMYPKITHLAFAFLFPWSSRFQTKIHLILMTFDGCGLRCGGSASRACAPMYFFTSSCLAFVMRILSSSVKCFSFTSTDRRRRFDTKKLSKEFVIYCFPRFVSGVSKTISTAASDCAQNTSALMACSVSGVVSMSTTKPCS